MMMKKSFVVPALGILSCVSITSQAWWGPSCAGAPYAVPYWGGYAPPIYAPPYPVYAPPPGNYYARPWGQPAYTTPWGPGPGSRPESDDFYSDDFTGPDEKDSFANMDEERKQAMEASAARRAAFHARNAARQAEMKAKRDAWRQQMEQMGPVDRYSGQIAPHDAVQPQDSDVTERQPAPISSQTQAPAPEPSKAPTAATTKP